jgi:hypothetical protein
VVEAVPRKQKRKAWTPKTQAHPWPPSRARLEELIAEAILDAYGDAEQRGGLYTMIEDHLALPFVTEVLGVAVTVERIDLTVTDAIVAICRRGKTRQAIAILDLPLPAPPPAGAEWIEAYRRWAEGG